MKGRGEKSKFPAYPVRHLRHLRRFDLFVKKINILRNQKSAAQVPHIGTEKCGTLGESGV